MKVSRAHGLLLVAACCGCNSSENRRAEAKPGAGSKPFQVVDYGSADPRQEPTLRLGGKVEVRTNDGGPVVIRSQQARQQRAAEAQRQKNDAAGSNESER